MYIVQIPFLDLDKMYNSGSVFSWTKIDEDKYFIVDGNWATTIKEIGTDQYQLSCTEEQWFEHWYNYFDMGTNYEKIYRSYSYKALYNIHANFFLLESLCYGYGIRILKQDPWQAIITFMISQNNNMKRIRKSVDLIKEKYGTKIPNTKEQYYFPTPSQLYGVDLSKCGLGYREEYITNLIDKLMDIPYMNEYNEDYYLSNILSDMSTEDLLKSLMEYKGIGLKVASCIALYGFHRLEIAPIDVHMKRIIDTYFNGNNPLVQFNKYEGLIQQWMFDYETINK